MTNAEIVDFFNGINKSNELAKGNETVEQLNEYYNKILAIKAWKFLKKRTREYVGRTPAVLEIDIPSASELSRIGKIEFCMTPGGIKDVEFDDETHTFYLPILNLKSDSEVILRNLVAYEGLMFEKGTFLNLDFTEYVDLMCGIIDSVKDVRILREKNIIEGDLDDDEIVKLFNGVTKSSLKTDEASGCKYIARVNKVL
ncbi:putative UPF0481 protein [Tanacetum coccineum]